MTRRKRTQAKTRRTGILREKVESITGVRMEGVDEDCGVQGMRPSECHEPVLAIVQEEPSSNDSVSPL